MSEKWDRRYLALARHVAGWSKDPSTKTGAVIVRADRTVGSIGFNGLPAGLPDDPEILNDREAKYAAIVHCEMNALLHMHDTMGLMGATLYTWPLASCDRCVVHLLTAGVVRFVAPPLTPELADRWLVPLRRTRAYIQQYNREFVELNVEEGG